MTRGIQRERALKQRLIADGWWVIRAAGSLGDADLVALKAGEDSMLIEVKSDVRGPFAHFIPAQRRALIEAACVAGAVAWLVWWPPRRQPVWIGVSEWPGPVIDLEVAA